jgi:hypothetical protein
MPRDPKCSVCEATITNPDFKFVWFQEGFEHIDIGPYCPDCFVKIKICSGCQHPFTKNKVTHVGKGKHFCEECLADLDLCGECGQNEHIHKVIDGKKWCTTCYSDKYFQCDCCEEDHLIEDNTWTPLQREIKKGLFKKYKNLCRWCYKENQSRFKTYDVRKCKCCSSTYAFTSADSPHYCSHCYSRFYKCDCCGIKTPKTSQYNLDSGDRIGLCENCLGREYQKCDFCKSVSKKVSRVSGTKSNYNMCQQCSEDESYGECTMCLRPRKVREGVCSHCFSTYAGNKCFCGQIKDMEGNCRVCDRAKVYSYSTKPRAVFLHTERDAKVKEKIFFGFENEMQFNSNSQVQLKKIYRAYSPAVLLAKNDSSIHGDGYEIVTQPMTLRYFHKLNLDPLFSGDNNEHSSCGLHVHVCREAFSSSLHILKVTKMIHEFSEFTDKIAGRSAGSYNGNFSQKISKVIKDDKKKSRIEGRGCRINLTNDVTIEFRLFLGCDTEYKLRYRVEFLHSLIVWSENVGVSQVTPENYKEYIKANSKKYPNIYRFLSL